MKELAHAATPLSFSGTFRFLEAHGRVPAVNAGVSR